MTSIKISRPNGEVAEFFSNPAQVECTEHFIKITDDRGNVYSYSYSHLIKVEEHAYENEAKRR